MSAARALRRSARGALAILAMFALGGALLWGLFRAPRAAAPRSPDVPWGLPSRPLRVVFIDCGWAGDGEAGVTPGEVIANLRVPDPDFVFLQGVRSEDALTYADRLGMQRSFHPRLYQALGERPRGLVGCLVLSKHALYDASPLTRGRPHGDCIGVRATAVVDGLRFWLVNGRAERGWDEAVERASAAAGSPPMITAFDSVEVGLNTRPRLDVKHFERIMIREAPRGWWAELARPPQ